MTDTVEYLEAQQIEAKIADAMATIVVERPADAAARLAQLLAPAPPPTDKYLDTVGRTPLIQLSRLLPAECKAKAVYVKMEMQNPGGSIKDRIAKGIIEQAEASGKLKPGMTVVEATSGNTGIGLAMCCAAKGYGCVIVMPQVPPMIFQALENLQHTKDNKSQHGSPPLPAKKVSALGTVIAGIGLGLLATQWTSVPNPTMVIGSTVTTIGILLMLFR